MLRLRDICIMSINNILSKTEFAQIGWVVPDIRASVEFLSKTLGIQGFPEPQHRNAHDANVKYHGKIVHAEWYVSQTYHGGTFIELIQPLSGQSIFQDYLTKYPAGGVQHMAFRLPVSGLSSLVDAIRSEGYEQIGECVHPIAHMIFFDTYKTLGVATEIMGITPEGWEAIEKMKTGGS